MNTWGSRGLCFHWNSPCIRLHHRPVGDCEPRFERCRVARELLNVTELHMRTHILELHGNRMTADGEDRLTDASHISIAGGARHSQH